MKEIGPEPAPNSFYLRQATVGRALEELKLSVQIFVFFVIFFGVIAAVSVVVGGWVNDGLKSLVTIHFTPEGKVFGGVCLAGWYLWHLHKTGLTVRQRLIVIAFNVPMVGLMVLLPEPYGILMVSFVILPAGWAVSSVYDSLVLAGRENYQRSISLARKAEVAESYRRFADYNWREFHQWQSGHKDRALIAYPD